MSSLNCKYCPTEPAAYLCENCEIGFCLNCVPEDRSNMAPRCTLCRKHLTSINSHQVVPAFWTQWLYFLRLPLTPMIFISLLVFAIFSLFMSLNSYLDVLIQGVFWGLFLMMLFEFTNLLAEGRTEIPPLQEIWDKGEPFLLIRLVLQVLFVVALIFAIGREFGNWAALCLFILYGLGFPASVLILALEKRFFSAANPLRIIYVISAIGLPYLLLYGSWLLAVVLSVQVMELQQDGHFLTRLVANQVTFCVWTAWFALLGYVTYQYHQQLGISVPSKHKHQRHQKLRAKTQKTNKSRVKSAVVKEAEILVTEQRYSDALNLLHTAMKQPMAEMDVHRYYLRLLVEQKDNKRLAHVAKLLVRQFMQQGNATEAAHIAVTVCEVLAGWRPETDSDCFYVAKSLVKMGRREFALTMFSSLMATNTISDFMAEVYFEAAKIQAESFNQDNLAIEYLQCIINDYSEHAIAAEAIQYHKILISSTAEQGSDQGDALIIKEN